MAETGDFFGVRNGYERERILEKKVEIAANKLLVFRTLIMREKNGIKWERK